MISRTTPGPVQPLSPLLHTSLITLRRPLRRPPASMHHGQAARPGSATRRALAQEIMSPSPLPLLRIPIRVLRITCHIRRWSACVSSHSRQTQTQPLGYIDNEQASAAFPAPTTPTAAPGATTTLAACRCKFGCSCQFCNFYVHRTQPPSPKQPQPLSLTFTLLIRYRRFSFLCRLSSPPPSPPRSPAPFIAIPNNPCDNDHDDARWPELPSPHASLHQFTPRDSCDPASTQTIRPGSAKDTALSYGQPTVKQQQQHQSDRRSRRASVGAGYQIIQTVSHLSFHVSLTRPRLILARRKPHIGATTR